MNIENIIKLIPQLFLYFIPGYLILKIRKMYRQESKFEEKDMYFFSIVISFIIEKMFFIIIFFLNIIIKIINSIVGFLDIEFTLNSFLDKNYILNINQIHIDKTSEWYVIFLLILSLFVSYFFTIYPNTKLCKKIRKLMKSNITSHSSVWNYALEGPGWAIVYLHQENVGYMGKVIKYTSNPDKSIREIYLTEFASFKIDSCTPIDDFRNCSNKGVWINTKNIDRIEFFKD